MSKKQIDDAFPNETVNEATVNTFGREQANQLPSGQGNKIKQVSIREIWPDVTQPRRTLPSGLRELLHIPREMFVTWIHQMFPDLTDTDKSQLIRAHLEGGETGSETALAHPLFFALVDLAASIKHDGLINPITVVLVDGEYHLETGERRWLAYHLLYAFYGEKWEMIPARIVDHVDVWRQASENSARANLNMVSRARQYAKLMMALYAGEVEFGSYQDFLHDRHFYAQVVDLRVPRGKNDQLMAACGIKSRSVLSTYRDILRLADDVWTQADDDNWTENELFGTPNNSPDDPPPPPQDVPATVDTPIENPLISKQTKKDYNNFLKTALKAGQGDAKAKRIALGYIIEQHLLLDRIKDWLTSNDVE